MHEPVQEAEVSEELLTFHKAIYQMQAQEEELIDCHHQLTDVCITLLLLLSLGSYWLVYLMPSIL